MKPREDLLFPRPVKTHATGELCRLSPSTGLAGEGEATPSKAGLDLLNAELGPRGVRLLHLKGPVADEAAIRLHLEPETPTQGYRLRVHGEGIDLVGGDRAGLFYGLATLAQWIRLHGPPRPGRGLGLRGLEVEDRPSLRHRGVMLDISRNRVPTLPTLCTLVERLAGWKINQLQLYMEHTFAYAGHEQVWSSSTPLTADDIRHLDAFCRERFIELVPNQNSFGHFHRWLIHEPYRQLAECPEGIEHPFSEHPEPFSLCPTDPGSLDLLSDLYDQLLPCFSSHQLNAGLDETLDLGQGRSAEACAKRGKEHVYLEYVAKVRALAQTYGKRLQMWADIVFEHPQMIRELPQDIVALAWGYEADHPFADQCRQLSAAGLDFYVCPGTSSWNSLASRGRNAILNLASAARAAADHGALGYLITDWGDNGHLQPLSASDLPLLAGAGFAWNAASAETPLELPLARLLDLHAFDDRGEVMGAAAVALADTYLLTGALPKNGTVLFHLLLSPRDALDHPRYDGMTEEHLETARAHLASLVARLAKARCAAGDLAPGELAWVAQSLDLACRLGLARLRAGRTTTAELPLEERGSLLRDLEPLITQLEMLWLARSRPGGLDASKARLENLRQLLSERKTA